uniref:Uncharacterized protein n=1 Tax=Anguilla anguilla TaxID=7936 RepID=A0A0E9QBQ8_ANGAN
MCACMHLYVCMCAYMQHLIIGVAGTHINSVVNCGFSSYNLKQN